MPNEVNTKEEHEEYLIAIGLEKKTERNMKVINSFMKHLEENDILIPEVVFVSYFEV